MGKIISSLIVFSAKVLGKYLRAAFLATDVLHAYTNVTEMLDACTTGC